MQIAIFRVADGNKELNEFLVTHDIIDNRVEIHNDWIYVFYKEQLTPAQLEDQKIKERIRQAEESLVEGRLHKGFLDVTDIGDAEKIEDAKKKNEMEMKNIEARLNLYKSWEILKN